VIPTIKPFVPIRVLSWLKLGEQYYFPTLLIETAVPNQDDPVTPNDALEILLIMYQGHSGDLAARLHHIMSHRGEYGMYCEKSYFSFPAEETCAGSICVPICMNTGRGASPLSLDIN